MPYRFHSSGKIVVGKRPVGFREYPRNTRKIRLMASSDNTGTIWVCGRMAKVDEGYPLYAGDDLLLEISNPEDLYFVSDAENQKLYYIFMVEG